MFERAASLKSHTEAWSLTHESCFSGGLISVSFLLSIQASTLPLRSQFTRQFKKVISQIVGDGLMTTTLERINRLNTKHWPDLVVVVSSSFLSFSSFFPSFPLFLFLIFLLNYFVDDHTHQYLSWPMTVMLRGKWLLPNTVTISSILTFFFHFPRRI